MAKIEWEDKFNYYELEARNVGNKNLEAKIQMLIEKLPKDGTKRRTYASINIPKIKVNEFLSAIQEKEGRQRQ